MITNRRRFLQLGAAGALATVFPAPAIFAQQRIKVRISSNTGPENDTLEGLLRMQDYLGARGLDAEFVKVTGTGDNVQQLAAGEADICGISGTNPIPDIANGAPIKIVGTAMKSVALSVFSANPDIVSVTDLPGRTVGIGPKTRLLHNLILSLLRQKGIDASKVNFVEVGSNVQVFAAVRAGKVDAGPSTVVSFYDQTSLGVHSLQNANMWSEIPDYTYQMMFASDRAIKDNREGIVRTLAAYTQLFRYLQSPDSFENYRKARLAANPKDEEKEARAVWRFAQEQNPYGSNVAMGPDKIRYMQELTLALGLTKGSKPDSEVADLSLAQDSVKLSG